MQHDIKDRPYTGYFTQFARRRIVISVVRRLSEVTLRGM